MASTESNTLTSQQGLCKQDLAKLDVAELTALSPEVISRQATINIGTIGHVAHGKSTVVKAVSGVQTVRFKNELERNITIKLEDVKEAETAPVHLDDMMEATEVVNENATSGRHEESIGKPTKKTPIGNASTGSQRATNGNAIVSETIKKGNAKDRKRMSNKSVIPDKIYKRKKPGPKPGTSSKRIKIKKPPEKKKDEVEYEVEEIICHKFLRGKHLYFVKWENWEDRFNTWEPLEHLSGCLPMLFEFFDKKAGKYCEKEFQELKYKLTIFSKDELAELMKEFHTGNSIEISKPDLSRAEYMLKIISRIPSADRDPDLLQLVRREYMIDSLYKKRVKQVEALAEWELEMNTISMDPAPLTVVNLVDLEEPPENFIYINDYLPGTDVYIPDDPPIGCSCEKCSPFRNLCCGRSFSVVYGYDKDLKIRVPSGSPIYECNKKCKCPPTCTNRVVQRGRQIKLCIFRTNTGCGWGVKTLEDIPKGTFVTEYVGEVIKFEEAEKRGKTYDRQEKTYLFDLDFNDSNHYPFTVDAAVYGNVSHFINHSCNPNMRVFAVWINCLDPNLPKLSFFASRDIKKGEEISFDYLCQSDAASKTNNKLDEVDDRLGFKMYCKCGSRRCRQYYF